MSRRHLVKGRSAKTYANKLRKIKKFYRTTFKNSKAQKELHMALPEKERPKKKYFCDRYVDEKSFLKIIKIKKSNKQI